MSNMLDAIAHLNERDPTAASNLDTDLAACIEHLAAGEFDGPLSRLRFGPLVRSWPLPPLWIDDQRQPGELLILSVCHQTRRPIVR